MPIRLIDSYGLARDKKLSVIANRGANGIDGTIATTVGVSRATGSGVTALLGDLTFLADVGSLRELAGSEAPTTIVVINNDGGGIFDFLPQADGERIEPGDYERFIRAPHGLELYPIAAAYGIESHLASGTTDLAEMLAVPAMQPRVIEIRTEPTSGPAAREAVLAALAG